MIKALLVLTTLGLMQACAFSVHEVHVGGFEPYTPKTEGVQVTASAERFVVMGFSDDTGYIEQAVAKLKSQCPDSELVGVSTEIQTALGFFSWTDRVYLRARCIGQTAAKEPETGKERPSLKARRAPKART